MFSLFQEVLSTSVVLNDNIVCGSPAEAVQLCLHCLQDVSTSLSVISFQGTNKGVNL